MPPPEAERIAALLGRHYAEDRLDAADLDRRLDLAFAGSPEALDGLPVLGPAVAPKRRWGRRHGEAGVASPGWIPTKERFIDPSTQRVMRVWVDPGDHSRHYVAETS
ncbi:DUF1707 domain-containing protein [Solirubrobacter soli]|uniref:DUF1707 domain-containing protein n=1 Tax=Solirubrobacter soli TaxID=363832 RepID=UPI0004227CF8|nr:DUF1707 domain-containing protein [Solirubrobacter soli]